MSDSSAPSPAPAPTRPPSILLSRSPSSFSSSSSSSQQITPQPPHKGGILLLQPNVNASSNGTSNSHPPLKVTSSRITFAPLPPAPPEDEKRRRNSISVGVAARGQILRSQGATGKKANNNGVIYVPMTDEEWEAYKVKFNREQGIPSEVPDLGTLALKGGRKLLSSIRRSMSSSSSTVSTSSSTTSNQSGLQPSSPSGPVPPPPPPVFQRTSSSSLSTTPPSPPSSEAFSLSPTSQIEPPLLPSPPSESDDDEFDGEFDDSLLASRVHPRAYSPPPLLSYEPTMEEYGFGSSGSTSGSSILEEEEEEEEEEQEREREREQERTGGNTTPKMRRGSFSGLTGMEHLAGGLGLEGGEGGSATPLGRTSFVLGFEKLTTSGPLKEDVESWRKERRASQSSRGSGEEERPRRSGSGSGEEEEEEVRAQSSV
ncbi:hypothetical protein BDY24DRAFT_388170 [Mrakia frigida]|uniref:uncharacterized protein n=1 Tax=Mrakia frigida TaxID=29902 RepID=UPI003FCC2269